MYYDVYRNMTYGKYNNDKKIGKWETHYKSGKIKAEENYNDDGELDGEYKEYYEDGKPKIVGSYVNGKKVGKWETHYKSGKIKFKGEMKDDRKLNGTEYDKNGNIIKEYKDGAVKEYDTYGKIIYEGIFDENEKKYKPTYEYTSYHDEKNNFIETTSIYGNNKEDKENYLNLAEIKQRVIYTDCGLNKPFERHATYLHVKNTSYTACEGKKTEYLKYNEYLEKNPKDYYIIIESKGKWGGLSNTQADGIAEEIIKNKEMKDFIGEQEQFYYDKKDNNKKIVFCRQKYDIFGKEEHTEFYKNGNIMYEYKRDKNDTFKSDDKRHDGREYDIDGNIIADGKRERLNISQLNSDFWYKLTTTKGREYFEVYDRYHRLKYIMNGKDVSKKTGYVKEFDENGRVIFEGQYKNGWREGVGVEYKIIDGMRCPVFIGNYHNNQLFCGVLYNYNNNGEITAKKIIRSSIEHTFYDKGEMELINETYNTIKKLREKCEYVFLDYDDPRKRSINNSRMKYSMTQINGDNQELQ